MGVGSVARGRMNYSENADIEISLNGDSGFTFDDVKALNRGLEPHFQPRFRARSAIVQFDTLPGAPPPPDVIIRIGEYVLAHLDDLGIGVLSNYLFRAIESLRQRRQRIDTSLDIQVVEEDTEHKRRTKWRVRGKAHSVDAIQGASQASYR
jgi:hypothetical protein